MRISDWSSDVCSSDLFGDQPVDLGRDVLFIERFFADVEIEAAFVRTDLAARHAVRDDGAEQMQAGVHAHVPVAAVPIDDGGNLRPRFRQHAAFGGDMHDRVAIAFYSGGHPDLAALGKTPTAAVARLAAAGRVENRAIEDDSAAVIDGDDLRCALPAVSILAKDFLGPGSSHDQTSSQSGVGRPFSRRKTGLKSFD